MSEIERLLQILFPKVKWERRIISKIVNNEEKKSIKYTIPENNNSLEDSPYFYKAEGLAHFTSLSSLLSIINSNTIRLYNLHNLNDPREFSFAYNLFKSSEEEIIDAKDNLFLMSFCDLGIFDDNNAEFNMWRLYGDDGNGIAIEFSIVNKPNLWSDVILSKVYYGEETCFSFKELMSYLNSQFNSEVDVEIDLRKLFAFHKSTLFKIEQEVRLVCFRHEKNRTGLYNYKYENNDKIIFPNIKVDLLKLSTYKNVKFVELPLFDINDNNKAKLFPILKIKKIVLGYKFKDNVDYLKNELIELCNEKLGYEPEIVQTKIKKIYWGE